MVTSPYDGPDGAAPEELVAVPVPKGKCEHPAKAFHEIDAVVFVLVDEHLCVRLCREDVPSAY